MANKNDTTMPVLAHVLGIVVGFLGPLIIMLVAEDENAKNHAKEALNWQISLIIYMIVAFILIFIFIGILLIIALAVLNVVFGIMAAVKAGEGKLWKYPLAIRFFATA